MFFPARYMAKLDRLAEEKKRKIMMARLQQEQEDQQSGGLALQWEGLLVAMSLVSRELDD